jgi:hypothetical protein
LFAANFLFNREGALKVRKAGNVSPDEAKMVRFFGLRVARRKWEQNIAFWAHFNNVDTSKHARRNE